MSFGGLLAAFTGRRALVFGDLMLDEYILGQATRISPEAPVMVVRQRGWRAVPGGAANVAMNMAALGALPSMVGVVGDDDAGRTLTGALGSLGILGRGLVIDPSRPTTRKTRVLANHSQQVLRIDHEEDGPVGPEVDEALWRSALQELEAVDVVLVSDYQKGAVTGGTVERLVAECRLRGIPLVANPKPRSLPHYRGAALVSLNRYEAGAALGQAGPVADEEAEQAAAALRETIGADNVLVTLGGSGMVAAGEAVWRVPAVKVEVYDEAGAGDTVIATVALGVGAGRFGAEVLALAAQTAAAVVRKVGVAAPSPEDLAAIAAL